MKSMRIGETAKLRLLNEAKTFNFPQLIEILERGKANALLLKGVDEATLIVDLLIFMLNRIDLQYPYQDEEHPFYNPQHEDILDDFMGGMWQKTLSTLKADFGVLWPGERKAA